MLKTTAREEGSGIKGTEERGEIKGTPNLFKACHAVVVDFHIVDRLSI